MTKKHSLKEPIIFLICFAILFTPLAHVMGIKNLFSSIMNTAHDLLLNTVFYLMAIIVLTSAFGKLLIEFGIVRLLEKLFKPLMKPIYNLPGVASLGGLLTFLSDNPAIISLANDKNFKGYFKKYQLVSLTNFGTAFGMGLIVMTFVIGQGFYKSAIIGFFGAVIGSIVSTRLMQKLIRKDLPENPVANLLKKADEDKIDLHEHKGSIFQRFLNAILDGGKNGVDLGLAIIPGVLIISTFVMMVSFGPQNAEIGYQGIAYEGVPILPYLVSYVQYPFKILFGFTNPEAIAFPITALGSVGASLGLIPTFLAKGIIGGKEIAVYTAMGMCWSGYLSTHSAMLDALKFRNLISKALLSHTIGGICAGISAHYIFVLVSKFL